MRAGVGVLVGLALAGAACDWREFDELKKKTPVAAISPPSNYPAGDDFGPILLPIAPPPDRSAAGQFVASAANRMSVGVMSFDAAGHPSGVGVTNTAFDLLEQWPITSIAPVPGVRKVLLGSPADIVGDVMVMSLDPPYMATTFQSLSEGGYGVGVGAGNIGGDAAPEFVVLSSSALHVYKDSLPVTEWTRPALTPPDPCPLEFSSNLSDRDRVNRAVIVAPLMAGGRMQIAVGTPGISGNGAVSIFDLDVGTGAFTCAATLTASEAHFGQAMTLIDLVGGDGQPDHLLVGAPPTHAYLYSLPLATGQGPSVTLTDPEPEPNGLFGAAVAAFNLDGNPGDEVFVGNPGATVNGAANAGRVSIYTGMTLALVPSSMIQNNPLSQHEPAAGHGYGSGIAGLTFCPGNVGGAADGGTGTADAGVSPCRQLLLVGSTSRVYAYFTLVKPDPRLKP
jgi:hypothetical protein